MKKIFGRHHVRANFYHFVSLLYVLTMVIWGLGIISGAVSTVIGAILFAIDYLAQMYDPHPNNPGPWFKRHFHRFLDEDDGDGELTDTEVLEDMRAEVIVKIILLVALVTMGVICGFAMDGLVPTV